MMSTYVALSLPANILRDLVALQGEELQRLRVQLESAKVARFIISDSRAAWRLTTFALVRF